MSAVLIELKNVSKTFRNVTAIEDVSLTVHKGDFICLLGQEGAGKTELMQIMQGLERPDSGSVIINNEDIAQAGKKKKTEMISAAECMFMDEPFAGLDAATRDKERRKLKRMQKKTGITTVFATRDREDALILSDIVVILNRGRIEQTGGPVEVYEKPVSPFAAEMMGPVNFFHSDIMNNANVTVDQELKDGLKNNPHSLKACRPENIEIVGQSSLNSFNVKIYDIEFRGSFYRLTLNLFSGNEALVADAAADADYDAAPIVTTSDDDLIFVDIPSAEFAALHLAAGANVSIRFRSGRLFFFSMRSMRKIG